MRINFVANKERLCIDQLVDLAMWFKKLILKNFRFKTNNNIINKKLYKIRGKNCE